MFSSTVVVSTKHLNVMALDSDVMIGDASIITPRAHKLYRQFDEQTPFKSERSESEIKKIFAQDNLIDFYTKKQQFTLLYETVLVCQKLRRMKQFRTALKRLKLEATKRAIELYELESKLLIEIVEKQKREEIMYRDKLNQCVTIIQRAFRMKQFRKHVLKIKVSRSKFSYLVWLLSQR